MITVARYVITELSDRDIDPNLTSSTSLSEYHVRKAARGVLVKDGKIALLNVTKENYHKLPGGGMELNESNEEAFKREVLEETGCECSIDDENGENAVTIEYWDRDKELQISYIFSATVVGQPKEVQYTDSEASRGFQLEWVPFDQVDQVLQKDNPSGYEGKFIKLRDKAIIDFYRKTLVGKSED